MRNRSKVIVAAAVLAASALVGTGPAWADGHGHGQRTTGTYGQPNGTYQPGNGGYTYNGQWYPNGQGPYPNGYPGAYPGAYPAGGDGNTGPHGCVNPAGHVRGWCKQQGAGYSGYGYGNYGAQQSLRGTIVSVHGDTVTLYEGGLSTISINVGPARTNGRIGNLYPGQSVTVYGYYSNGTFYATSIG